MSQPCAIDRLAFRAKALGLHLGFAPLGTPPMLNRQRLARLDIQDDPIDLGAIQRALDVGCNGNDSVIEESV